MEAPYLAYQSLSDGEGYEASVTLAVNTFMALVCREAITPRSNQAGAFPHQMGISESFTCNDALKMETHSWQEPPVGSE